MPKLCVLSDTYTYGTEFYGAEQYTIPTPLTDRCSLSMWQASRVYKGSAICGKSNSGKTQIVKVKFVLEIKVSNSN
jgi:hypothetical protein